MFLSYPNSERSAMEKTSIGKVKAWQIGIVGSTGSANNLSRFYFRLQCRKRLFKCR